MSNVQIFTPTLPYVGQLPGELRYGSRIKLRGHFREPQDTVHIILQQETLLNPNTDVPLYITLNPGRHEIVRHRLCSKNCSHGQDEERAINCPIAYGQDFELSIVPTGAGFEIGLHGTPVHTFAHHLPPAVAHYLFVSSGCVIFAITFENWSGERPYGLPQPSAPQLQLPRLYPTMEQPVAPQHQQPKYPVQQIHQQTHHENLLQELILQVLPLMQLAAEHSPSANSHAVTVRAEPGHGNGGQNTGTSSMLPCCFPSNRTSRARRCRWTCWRPSGDWNMEILPAVIWTCSVGVIRLLRFLAVACVFGYIGYAFTRNVKWP